MCTVKAPLTSEIFIGRDANEIRRLSTLRGSYYMQGKSNITDMVTRSVAAVSELEKVPFELLSAFWSSLTSVVQMETANRRRAADILLSKGEACSTLKNWKRLCVS